MVVSVAGVTLFVTGIDGLLVKPLLTGRFSKMNNLAAFASLVFWGWLWGGWGLLLAVPITAAIKAVCERVDDWNGFADLLSH